MTQSANQPAPTETAKRIDDEIRREIETNIAYYAGHPDEIDRRLEDLDEEWDIERAIQAMAASVSLFGGLGRVILGRLWHILPFASQVFLLQHAITRWSPPAELFRRMGFRTPQEIDTERFALKALRGDFRDLPQPGQIAEGGRAKQVMQAVQH